MPAPGKWLGLLTPRACGISKFRYGAGPFLVGSGPRFASFKVVSVEFIVRSFSRIRARMKMEGEKSLTWNLQTRRQRLKNDTDEQHRCILREKDGGKDSRRFTDSSWMSFTHVENGMRGSCIFLIIVISLQLSISRWSMIYSQPIEIDEGPFSHQYTTRYRRDRAQRSENYRRGVSP